MRRRKVLIIIFIILALLIGTPMLVWSIWCWSAQRKLDAVLDELRQRGEPLTFAEMAPPEIPDDQNAAILYEEAFAKFRALSEETRKRYMQLPCGDEPLQGDQFQEIREVLQSCRDVLKSAREAARKPAVRMPVEYQEYENFIPLRFAPYLRTPEGLLSFSARLNLAENKPDPALADCETMLQLPQAFDNIPMIVAVLCRVRVEQRALRLVRSVLDQSEPSAAALQQIYLQLSEEPDRQHLVQAMRGERCEWWPVLRDMIEEPFTIDMDWDWKDRLSCFAQRPLLIRTAVRFLSDMDKIIELTGKPSYAVADEWKALTTITLTEGGISLSDGIISMILPKWETSLRLFDSGIATRESARLAIALRLYRIKHGEYPEPLGALVPDFLEKLPTDPFSGKDFIYRREGKGFIVYSVGFNMTDNGGVEDPKDRKAGDIVWKCSR